MNRPVHRYAVKIAALALGRKWSHGHNWMPFLRFENDGAADSRSIVYKGRTVGRLSPADLLREQLSGDAIHIIGSGPSVSETDLTAIGSRSTVFLNGAFQLIGSQISDPLAIVVEDERFIWRHFESLKVNVPSGVICIFSVGVIRAICEIDSEWLTGREILLIDDIRKPYMTPKPDIGDISRRPHVLMNTERDAGLSLQPDLGVFQGGSVVISALQYAIYCRPKSIGLIGIDISNANEPRFYERKGNAAPSGLKRAENRIVSHLMLGKTVCTSKDIEIRNHSPTSLLNSHDFTYDSRFEKSKAK